MDVDVRCEQAGVRARGDDSMVCRTASGGCHGTSCIGVLSPHRSGPLEPTDSLQPQRGRRVGGGAMGALGGGTDAGLVEGGREGIHESAFLKYLTSKDPSLKSKTRTPEIRTPNCVVDFAD